MTTMTTSICNKCGGSRTPEGCPVQDVYGAAVRFDTGYFSKALPDGNVYDFELCEPCVAELMDTFKIPPRITEYM